MFTAILLYHTRLFSAGFYIKLVSKTLKAISQKKNGFQKCHVSFLFTVTSIVY